MSAKRLSGVVSGVLCGIAAISTSLILLAPATSAATGSIVDRLSADHTAIEVTSEPSGTNEIHVAVMSNLAGQNIKYLNISATQTRYTPPAATPVVDVQAMKSGTPIGSWAGRKQVSPKPVEEPRKEEAPKEEASTMTVALDAGGWSWESAVRDFSGAVHFLRASDSYYASDSQMSLLAKYHVHLLPLFNGSPSSNRTEFANSVYDWFARYGRGGTFWAGHEDLGATTAEIVNEPGNPYFWGSGAQTDQSSYAALVEAVAAKVATLPHPPRLLVSFDGGYEGDNYGRLLIKDDPHLLQLGIGWTVHPYGGHGSTSALGARNRVSEAYEATRQSVYVTEVGWPTAVGQPATGDSLQWTQQQQVENIDSFMHWAYGLGYVKTVVYFNYADYGTNNWYGIVNTTGTVHKLSYTALANLAATL